MEVQQIARKGYYAAVSQTDWCVGRVLDELERLGLESDTVVVAHSDHGLSVYLSVSLSLWVSVSPSPSLFPAAAAAAAACLCLTFPYCCCCVCLADRKGGNLESAGSGTSRQTLTRPHASHS